MPIDKSPTRLLPFPTNKWVCNVFFPERRGLNYVIYRGVDKFKSLQ